MDLKPVLIEFINKFIAFIDLIRVTYGVRKEALISIDRIEELNQRHYMISFLINWKSGKMLNILKEDPSILIGSSGSFAKDHHLLTIYELERFDLSFRVEKKKIKMVAEVIYKESANNTTQYIYLISGLVNFSEEEFDMYCSLNPLLAELSESESFMSQLYDARMKLLKAGHTPRRNYKKFINELLHA